MGEQTLYEARQHLGIAMGLQFHDVTTLPLPSDTFPRSLSGKSLSIENNKMEFIQLSNKNRTDLLALEKLEKEAMILLTAARIDMKPQLDLSLSMGYQSLDETDRKSGYYNAFRENVEGLNGGATLSLQYPFGNNAASGLLHQRKSSHLKTRIQTADLERNIHSYVVVAIHALIQKTAELGEAQKAVLYSRKALDNEKLKLHMGMSTVIDVLDIEDRFRTALQGEVSAQKEYALAVLQLRFATGTLLGENKGCYTVTTEQLTTIPIP
jgi:outer membrane protein TolC